MIGRKTSQLSQGLCFLETCDINQRGYRSISTPFDSRSRLGQLGSASWRSDKMQVQGRPTTSDRSEWSHYLVQNAVPRFLGVSIAIYMVAKALTASLSQSALLAAVSVEMHEALETASLGRIIIHMTQESSRSHREWQDVTWPACHVHRRLVQTSICTTGSVAGMWAGQSGDTFEAVSADRRMDEAVDEDVGCGRQADQGSHSRGAREL